MRIRGVRSTEIVRGVCGAEGVRSIEIVRGLCGSEGSGPEFQTLKL